MTLRSDPAIAGRSVDLAPAALTVSTLDPVTQLVTPDGRYFVVRGRLWRCTNPSLPAADRDRLTHELMDARRAKKAAFRADDHAAVEAAKAAVDAAKVALGERGPVWWTDGSPDVNRHLARNTHYGDWYASVSADEPDSPDEPDSSTDGQR